jgi:anti-sigma factor RsiW
MTFSAHPRSDCDLLLDDLYGELDAAARERFETHLTSCATCQDELASMRQVRSAARQALPFEEPPARVTGPLHAELLYEAARRTGRRRRGFRFVRRIVAHPGYAAAAALVVVGGALGVEWSRSHILISLPPYSKPASPVETTPSLQPSEPRPTGYPTKPAEEDRNLLAKAGNLAASDRCDEAVALYAAIHRRSPKLMTPDDRRSYDRCRQATRGNSDAAASAYDPRDRGSAQMILQRRTTEKRKRPAKKAKNAKSDPDQSAPILKGAGHFGNADGRMDE